MVTALIVLYFISAITNSKKIVILSGVVFSFLLYPETFFIICAISLLVKILSTYVIIKDLYIALTVLVLILLKNTFFSTASGYQLVGVSFALFQVCYYIKDNISCGDLISKLSFFPQLYCGPIVKPSSFDRLKKINIKSLALYHLIFAIGLFFKIYVAYVTHKIFLEDNSLLNSVFWLAYMYSDYLSWSLMGIGIAGLAGFKMPMSFRAPFFCRNVSQFYSRWNITVFKWCNDFFKVSGSKKYRKYKAYINIIVSVSVLSLWHGLTFNFLSFGIFNITYFLIQNKIKKYRKILLISQILFYFLVGYTFNGIIPNYIFPTISYKYGILFIVSLVTLFLFDFFFYRKVKKIISISPPLVIAVSLIFVTISFFVRHIDGQFYYAQF
ncbi:MBOAT family O-acyltransferase [Gallaecimonas mangrovi]|uniref:MBOAT family O-acyltransferase n=1 Tax=Gallaecimonas mangrovi TaxID=2291597 RepID=UPI0018685EA4|nr:MBOAT family O-acyltransferase [Gallaecimonas mangrovi]